MSVLVPSLPSANNSHSHFFSNSRINGNPSQSIKQMPLTSSSNLEDDQVPFGVVNSMKQRLLDKFNQSSLINTRQLVTKSANENLFPTKSNLTPLKQTTRLSRSHDDLLNHQAESLASFLQPRQEVIIVETTLSNEAKAEICRLSYTELHVDEVPKPGTVSTVKNMFERQIRLSRHDYDKSSNTLLPANSRRREVRSSNRSRSISPNDMALRQRRAAPVPVPTLVSLPVSTSYPDLIISHTPSTSSHVDVKKLSNEEHLINTQRDENPPLDFKSRLALFNRTNTVTQSDEHLPTPINVSKPFHTPQSVAAPPNFLTKPVVHRHQTEKSDLLSEVIIRSVVPTTKSVTFFGGEKVTDHTQLTPPPSIDPLQSSTTIDETFVEFFDVPDVIGGNVKLNKSSIFSGIKKDTRVQFTENVNTFEYPSLTIIMSDNDDMESDDEELKQLARINAELISNNLSEKSLELKGTLQTFRPAHLDQYQLGSQHASTTSDRSSREKDFTLSENFSKHSRSKTEMTNHIPWSSMSTTTADLLF